MNYEAIYSEELKCIECEVQAGYSYTGASVIEKLSRCLKKDDEEKERRSPFRLILFEDENIKVSLGPMSTELAFLSLFKRGRRHMYDLSRYTNRPSVRIENIECKKEVEARKILEKVTNSIFYQIDFLYSSTITLVSRRESRDERLRKEKEELEMYYDLLGFKYEAAIGALYARDLVDDEWVRQSRRRFLDKLESELHFRRISDYEASIHLFFSMMDEKPGKYVSLTDIARKYSQDPPGYTIQSWMASQQLSGVGRYSNGCKSSAVFSEKQIWENQSGKCSADR